MKTGLGIRLFVSVIFFAGASLFGGEPRLTQAGSFPLKEAQTELKIMRDLQDGFFVFSISGGRLEVRRSGGTGNLELYQVEGLETGEARGEARHLTLQDLGPRRYAAFINRKDGAETVFLLALDHQGELHAYPIPETRTQGIIDDYRLTPDEDGPALYLLAQGVLSRITGVGDAQDLRIKRLLSDPKETVEAFDFAAHFSGGFASGWYRSLKQESRELTLISTGNNGLVYRENFGPWETGARMNGVMTLDGFVYTFIAGKKVAVIEGTAHGLRVRSSFEAPVEVGRYIPARGESESGILLGGHEDGESIYGVGGENSGAPRFQRWFTLNGLSIREIIAVGERKIAALYLREGIWRSALINGEGVLLHDDPLGELSAGERLLERREGENRLYAVQDGGNLTALIFDRDRWTTETALPLPEDSGEIGASAMSRMVNGVLFRAVQSGNRVLVYRQEGGAQ